MEGRRRGRLRVAGLGTVALVACLVACQEIDLGDRFAPGEIDFPDDLYAVTAVGAEHVWAAGYFGSILHSEDGGVTWERQDSGTQRSIYDISFADPLHGWAVGRRGFIIHTSDGGDTWTRQESPRRPPRHQFAVHAVSPEVAWTVGDWGSRYVTRDGGRTWEDLSFLVSEDHPTFKYLTDEELETFYSGGKVYDDVYLNDVFFLDDQRGWIAAEYGLIYYTRDGGRTWDKSDIRGTVEFEPVPFEPGEPDVPRTQWPQLFDAAEILNAKSYLRVRVEGFMTRAELRAAGDTVLADDRAQSVSDFLEGEGVSQDRIRILNPTPFDQESVDMAEFTASKLAAQPQVRVHVIETPFLFDVKFSDARNGLIAGLGGVLLQSSDGGETWVYRDSGARQGLYAVGIGSRASMAVGEKGLHRRSLDGGRTWERLEVPFQDQFQFFGFMRDLTFATPERGWIVGQEALVLRSSDGGLSWERVDPVASRGGGAAAE